MAASQAAMRSANSHAARAVVDDAAIAVRYDAVGSPAWGETGRSAAAQRVKGGEA